MGVLDRLRRRSAASAAADASRVEPAALPAPADAELPSAPAATDVLADAADEAPEFRGDFMLLPPMQPTFGLPPRLQRAPREFLTTARPLTVTTEPMAHDLEPSRMGLVMARARRSSRPSTRAATTELVHRHLPDGEELPLEDEAPAVALPRPTPRTLRVSAGPPPKLPDLAGELPSVAQVHRSVRAPQTPALPAPRAKASSISDEEREAVLEAARVDPSADTPVMRRRGSLASAASEEADEPAAPARSATNGAEPVPAPSTTTGFATPDYESAIDLDALAAPAAADMPPITGPARVRGAQPPTAPASRPLLGAQEAAEPYAEVATPAAPEPPMLEHLQAPTPAADESDVPPAPAAGRGAGSMPTPTGATPTAGSSGSSPSDAGTMRAAGEPPSPTAAASTAPAGPRLSRPILASAPPLSGLLSPASDASTPAPPPAVPLSFDSVSRGATGIQRKARGGTSSMPSVSPAPSVRAAEPTPAGAAGMSAPSPSSAPEPVDTSAPAPAAELQETAGPTSAPEPTSIPVPQEVRRAVAEATGKTPDTALVHQGEHASAEADAVNAEAFTRDGQIYLAADADLSTPKGQALLAHELTHVMQQDGQATAMPDENSRAGQAHEQAARTVERAIAKAPAPATPSLPELAHAGTTALPGAAAGSPAASSASASAPGSSSLSTPPSSPSPSVEPVSVPQGVQRAARPANPSIQDDDDRVALPPLPQPERAFASVQQPTLKEQVDLVHAAARTAPVDMQQSATTGLAGLSRPAPATVARPEGGAGSGPAGIPATTVVAPSTPAGTAESGSPGGAASGGRSPGAGAEDSGGVARPEPSMWEKGLSYFSRMTTPPAGPRDEDETERGELERQADSLYPFLRSRLRAELVRDLERRGRLMRDWR